MDYTVIRNDITRMEVDAIVLPANPELKEGSGASNAIFKKAGRDKLKKACINTVERKGEIRVGTAVPTLGFDLDAKYVIHVVVPQWRGGNNNEYQLLSSAYYSSLKLADIMGCGSLAIPLLASGNNKFNLDLAIEIAIKSIEAFEPSNELSEVYLVVYGMRAVEKMKERGFIFEEAIDEAYVLCNDESYRPKTIQSAVKQIAQKYFDEVIDQGLEYFNDPENIKTIVGFGIEIVDTEIKMLMRH